MQIKYEAERLQAISRIDDSQEIAPPPFKIMCIEMNNDGDENRSIKLIVTPESQMSIEFDGLAVHDKNT